MKFPILLLALCLWVAATDAHAQSFSSGSTGADGALDLTNTPNPSTFEIQLPESGVLNYTIVNIPMGRTVVFKRNLRNTPVTLLAQGQVIIDGAIDVSATGQLAGGFCGAGFNPIRAPGPGGFYGGQPNQPGLGPGGGISSGETGSWVGPLSLVPIVGGSGGAGAVNNVFGGAGGGAIVVASSASITLSQQASIKAVGTSDFTCFGFFSQLGNSGSGGAIRLVSNSINAGGVFNACNVFGAKCGVVRLEAPSGALAFTGSSSPAAVLSTINPVVANSAPPSLTIISIGGYTVPSYAGSRFDTVDLLLPNQLADPINIVVRGNNIPLGTQVEVRAINGSGGGTFTPGTLAGAFENSTGTATASGLSRTGVTYLIATAVFDPPESAAVFNPKGPDQVAKVRVEAVPGARPKFVFLRGNGTVVNESKLSKSFLQQFGQ